MSFTIEKDLTIKGTRGETGNIHITFDRDMTGTKGVFLVKRSFDTSDSEAFLVKNFIFGTNTAITGRELLISLTREDTENMPIMFPDSPYVFESDYKDIEYSEYVWAIKLGSDSYTQTVIPRPGTTYPVFRLYNEAYFDRSGTPVVPHPPFPSPDIYATKRELVHYAAVEKQVTDELSAGIVRNTKSIEELSGGVRIGFLDIMERHLSDIDGLDQRIDAIEETGHDIPGLILAVSGLESVVSGHTAAIGVLGIKVTGMESKVVSAVERSYEAADAAIEAKETVLDVASSVNARLDSFTDLFVTSGGEVVSGVDAKKVYMKSPWAEPDQPVLAATLGVSMPALGESNIEEDAITIEDAIKNLNEYDTTLSGCAKNTDDAILERIEAISSGVGPGLTVLSGNVVKEFGAVRSEITSLSSNSKGYADALYSRGIMVISAMDVEIDSKISALSGNAASADAAIDGRISGVASAVETLASEIAASIANVSGSVNSLSGNAKVADDALSSSISTLAGSVTTLSGNAKLTDDAIAARIVSVDSKIANLSGNAKITDDALASSISTTVSSIVTLSGNAKSVDDVILGKISELSGGASGDVSALATRVTTLSSNAATTDGNLHGEVTTLSGNVKEYVVAVSGTTYENAVTDALTTINWFLENTYTPWIQASDRQILSDALTKAATGDAVLSGAISSEIIRATLREDELIEKDSIIDVFSSTLDNTTVPGAKATYDFVNSSINNLAAYYITKDAAGNAFASHAELTEAIASKQFFNGGALRTPTKNDYLVVLSDETHVEKGLTPTTRYVFDGTNWAFQYIVNSTAFTQAQVDALNSGITSGRISTITESVSTLSGNAKATDETMAAAISTLSGNAKGVDEALATSIGTVSGNLTTLSANAKTRDYAVYGSITSLSSYASAMDTSLNGLITSLSSNAKTRDDSLASSISTLSGSAKGVDDVLSSGISTLSGNSKSADEVLATRITTLSGSAKTNDETIASRVTAVSGYATNHESRIVSKEFTSQAVANTWVKDIVPQIDLDDDGTMKDTSLFTEEQTMKLLLAIVKKMVKPS